MSELQERTLQDRLHIILYHYGYEVEKLDRGLKVKASQHDVDRIVSRVSDRVSVSPITADPRWTYVHVPLELR